MTRPVFVLDDQPTPAVGGTFALTGAEGRHAATVRRIGVGEQLDVVDGRGTRLGCVVTAVAAGELRLQVQDSRFEPAPDPQLVLVQALAKGDRDELAIAAATELGVDAIVPWQAARCIVAWRGERAAKGQAKWQLTVREAAKQARRAWVPPVAAAVGQPQLVELIRDGAATLVLHESATTALADVRLPASGRVLLVVGPEGGITESELTELAAAGAVPVRLGPHVLRSSTAGPAAVAAVSAAYRWR
jgi:16S rRNA (uracil1498-N3)-methyltransferase